MFAYITLFGVVKLSDVFKQHTYSCSCDILIIDSHRYHIDIVTVVDYCITSYGLAHST